MTQTHSNPLPASPPAVVADAQQLRAAPLAQLLVSGGDPRIALDAASGLNSYGCAAVPATGVISYASSTASTISDRAFAAVERARDAMAAAADKDGLQNAFTARMEAMRKALKGFLGIDDKLAEVVFSPSGTDAQLLALFVAQAALGKRMTSIIVASNETGGGTVFTAKGRHFSTLTAQGVSVGKDGLLSALGEDMSCIDISARDADGAPVPPDAMEQSILHAVELAIAAGNKVLLQAMDSSKLGCRSPGYECLKAIAARWPQDVLVVVDACQMRLGRARLNRYLEDGFLILLTGSKFFTGPPFSGALLVPQKIAALMADITAVPAGLCDYTNQSDWPACWPGIRAALPARLNIGQWLRWEAVLAEMEHYFAVPEAQRRERLASFAASVTQAIAASPALTLLPEPPRGADADTAEGLDDAEMTVRTIFAFSLTRAGSVLATEDCKKIYHALNRDVSALLPPEASARDKQLAAQRCHIGQPVTLGAAAVLRINAGARLVSDGWTQADVETVIAKTELLLANPALVNGAA